MAEFGLIYLTLLGIFIYTRYVLGTTIDVAVAAGAEVVDAEVAEAEAVREEGDRVIGLRREGAAALGAAEAGTAAGGADATAAGVSEGAAAVTTSVEVSRMTNRAVTSERSAGTPSRSLRLRKTSMSRTRMSSHAVKLK